MSFQDLEPGTLLASLDAEQVAALLGLGRERTYRRGAVLVAEGDDSDAVLAILAGRVKVTATTEDGHETVLSMRGPGELVGELSVFDSGYRSATVAAAEDVRAVSVPGAAFRNHVMVRPALALLLLQQLSRRLRESDAKLAEFTSLDSVGRVANRLVELADRYGRQTDDGLAIDVDLSQEELAAWTGSSREAVSKALKAMREMGWVQTRRRRFLLLDPAALRRRAR